MSDVTVRFEDRGSPLDGRMLKESLEEEGLSVDYTGQIEERGFPTLLQWFLRSSTSPSGSAALLGMADKGVGRWKARRAETKGMPSGVTVRILGPDGGVLREVTILDDAD